MYKVLILSLIFHAFYDLISAQHVDHSQFRQYTCIEHGEAEVTDCRLTFMTSDDEPITVTDSGCFMEKDMEKQELRNFCPLQCANSDFVYIIGQRPSDHLSCREKETFNVVRRRNDWFLWRSAECLTEEIQFDIGCINSQYLDKH
uniref:Uncharacterized protein n=1 Tax=Panagrolaimus sp. JU765 TaxID=591449 RepID=A0AC34RI99_9BILA